MAVALSVCCTPLSLYLAGVSTGCRWIGKAGIEEEMLTAAKDAVGNGYLYPRLGFRSARCPCKAVRPPTWRVRLPQHLHQDMAELWRWSNSYGDGATSLQQTAQGSMMGCIIIMQGIAWAQTCSGLPVVWS